MSVIGPRPQLVRDMPKYQKFMRKYQKSSNKIGKPALWLSRSDSNNGQSRSATAKVDRREWILKPGVPGIINHQRGISELL